MTSLSRLIWVHKPKRDPTLSASRLQMPLNESNVVERARRLLVCTIDAANFSDKMDVIFVAEMIEKISKFVEKFKDVSGCTSRVEGRCLSQPLLFLPQRAVVTLPATNKLTAVQLSVVTLLKEKGRVASTLSSAAGRQTERL